MADVITTVTRSGQYRKCKFYVEDIGEYDNIHIFETLPNTQSIAPAISLVQTQLANMNPSNVAATKVIAKTNACMFDAASAETYGLFYAGDGQPIYIDGNRHASISSVSEENPMFSDGRYWPSFCVKKDGTATIRWFTSKSKLQTALPYCKCIIGAVHPLIFAGKNIFETTVADPEGLSGCVIYNNNANASQRFLHGVGAPFAGKRRTLLGHKAGSNGVYYMVCNDGGYSLGVAARLMKALNCDYAVAMDGGSPSQMRIKNGYGANGQVTSGSPDNIFSAVCAHLL